MFTFFDFLCYSAYKLYGNFNDDGPEFAAALVVSGLQCFNIYSVVLLYGMITEIQYFTKVFGLCTFGVLLIVNYIRYIQISKFSIEAIKAKWDMKTLSNQEDSRLLQGVYVIISIVTFFGLILYLASKKM